MPHWNPESVVPSAPETALIAVDGAQMFPDSQAPYLASEVYRFDVALQKWVGETSGLLLKHTKFWWMREGDILALVRQ